MQNNLSTKRMERPKITAKTKIYVVIVVLILAAIKTIIPFPFVSKACLLGYKAGCSFAPISTVMLLISAGITYVVAKRKNIL